MASRQLPVGVKGWCPSSGLVMQSLPRRWSLATAVMLLKQMSIIPFMEEHTFKLDFYAHIFTNFKNSKCKVDPKYNFQKKTASSPIKFGKHMTSKNKICKVRLRFFSVKLLPIKVIKLNQINNVKNIQVQACYRKGSKKKANNPLGG